MATAHLPLIKREALMHRMCVVGASPQVGQSRWLFVPPQGGFLFRQAGRQAGHPGQVELWIHRCAAHTHVQLPRLRAHRSAHVCMSE